MATRIMAAAYPVITLEWTLKSTRSVTPPNAHHSIFCKKSFSPHRIWRSGDSNIYIWLINFLDTPKAPLFLIVD